MKTWILSFFLLGLCNGSRANEIDKLQTKKDVEHFLIKYVRFNPEYFRGFSGDDSSYFLKLDLNGDARTDLLVFYDESIWAIVYHTDRQYDDFRPGNGRSGSFKTRLAGIDSSGAEKKLIIEKKQLIDRGGWSFGMDTLVWHAGGFMEYNRKPMESFTLGDIEFSTGRCKGKCPVFTITVDANGNALYNAEMFNKKQGQFKGKIPENEMTALMETLQYLCLDCLENNYAVPWTDDREVYIKVHYNGKFRRIDDYGGAGTIGLQKLYNIFFRWSAAIEWK